MRDMMQPNAPQNWTQQPMRPGQGQQGNNWNQVPVQPQAQMPENWSSMPPIGMDDSDLLMPEGFAETMPHRRPMGRAQMIPETMQISAEEEDPVNCAMEHQEWSFDSMEMLPDCSLSCEDGIPMLYPMELLEKRGNGLPMIYQELFAVMPEALPVRFDAMELRNMGGFLRTQIGRDMRVEFLVGTDGMVEKRGRLLGVGDNYILLNENGAGDVVACSFYNIKFVTIGVKTS